jgi:hypothetical protein
VNRWVGSNALLSLQIIQSESHPNMFNQGPGKKSSSGKEGLSIYGLFRRFAYTPQGRARLKQMFFCPSLNLEVIRERHEFIAMFSRPGNLAALEKMTKGWKHIRILRSCDDQSSQGKSVRGVRRSLGLRLQCGRVSWQYVALKLANLVC